MLYESDEHPELGVLRPDGTIVPQTHEWDTDNWDACKQTPVVRWNNDTSRWEDIS